MVQPPVTMNGSALTALQKKDVLNRLARVEGQLRGVQRLIGLAEVPGDIDAVAQQMVAAGAGATGAAAASVGTGAEVRGGAVLTAASWPTRAWTTVT